MSVLLLIDPKPETERNQKDIAAMRTTSLTDYRNRFPESDTVPSLTQSGDLAALMRHSALRRLRRHQRREFWRRLIRRSTSALRSLNPAGKTKALTP